MQLENMMEMYQPRVSETRQQTYFVVGDLEGMSASVLYTDIPEYKKFVDITWREDSDEKIGDHINYEVWMKKIGSKEGRNLNLSNTHILIPPTIKNGS
jgi:hypothetical protein